MAVTQSVQSNPRADSDPKFAGSTVNESAEATTKSQMASTLLAFEAGVRALNAEIDLFAHWCNETRRFVGYRQAFLFRSSVRDTKPRLIYASSLPAVDKDAPFVRWLEKVVGGMNDDVGLDKQNHFALPAYCDDTDEETRNYPFTEFLWTPLIEEDSTVGGFLTVRETPWIQNEQLFVQRFCQLYVHSWQSIKGRGRIARKQRFSRKKMWTLAALAGLLAIFPVSITALAPAEVAPLDPLVVAAPFNGVVKEILVEQGASVSLGDNLIEFEDVEWRNSYDIADETESVARARYQRESQRAIADPRAKREIAVARAELELATTEKAYAEELLKKTKLAANGSGLAIYTDKRDWIGKPVSAGESILQIANPERVRFSIDLPVRESLVLQDGARIKVFLDSDPLNPMEAVLVEASYQPVRDKRDILSYRLSGELRDEDGELPRIGVQGTAQIYGGKAPLIYVLLRKPLASLRQFTGW